MIDKRILGGLLIFEMIIGIILMIGGLFSNPINWFIILLGGGITVWHIMEYLVLREISYINEYID